MVNVSARSVLPPDLDPSGGRGRKRRRHPALRLVNLVAVVLSITVLIASVGGFIVVKWFDSSIARVHLTLGKTRPAEAVHGSENWLLVGTDNGTAGEYGVREGTRSDTTILTHLDANGTTTNVSFPRDTLVTIPEYTDSKNIPHPAHKAKFNEAISDGGPSLLVRTVEAMTGIRIDHYVAVDLDGFKRISEAVNGVRVCILHSDHVEYGPDGGVITNISDGYSGFHGVDGEQTVVGDQALAFVRQRHGLPNQDIDRIKRQQQFLGAVFRQALQANLLVNPVRVTKLLAAIKDALTLDQDTSLTDLENLAVHLRGVDASKVSFETVPQRGLEFSDTDLGSVTPYLGEANGIPTLTPTGQTENVGNVQVLIQPAFDQMIAKLKGSASAAAPSPGATGPSSATPKYTVTVPPSQVLVTVQNGVGRAGMAGQVTTALTKEGFRTGAPGPADRLGYVTSEVHYGPDDKAAATTVAAAVPGSVLKEDPSVTNGVVLIVGSSFSSVIAVTPNTATSPTGASGSSGTAPTPTPTPTASASPALPPVTAASAGNRCTY